MRRARDDAQMMVLEAFLAAMIFLGAATFVTIADQAHAPRETELLATTAADALNALLTLASADGQPLVDDLIHDAWTCAEDAASPACSSAAHAAAASRLRAYLPPGASYELSAGDASATIRIGRASTSGGPSLGATAVHVPTWKYGILAPTVSCRDAGASVRAEMIFLENGYAGLARRVALAEGGAAAREGELWTATLTPSGTTIAANATMREGTISSGAPIGTCILRGHAAALGTAITTATYDLVPADGGPMLPGRELTVRHDLSSAGGLAALLDATLEIYAPASNETPMWRIPLGNAPTGTASWSFPATALHGCYATQLRATWLASDGAASEELVTRRLGLACVTLPTGHAPPVPMYRVTLRTWAPDWSG